MTALMAFPLYRPHELSFRTQYAEVKERSRAAGRLLPGTPGRLVLRTRHRIRLLVPRLLLGPWPGRSRTSSARRTTTRRCRPRRSRSNSRTGRRARCATCESSSFRSRTRPWPVSWSRLHNAGLFEEAACSLVGTLCYMAWLNELGVKAVIARTQDIDLARRRALQAGHPPALPGHDRGARELKFSPVPGMPSRSPPTSVKRPGANELRIDVLADGPTLGSGPCRSRSCSGTRRPCPSTTTC